MPVWRARSGQEQGALTLVNWRVVQLPNGNRHLVGYCIENKEGRTSSAVRKIEVRTLQVTTKSGRTYILRGHPSRDPDADYVWRRWAALNSVQTWKDVAASIWQKHTDAQHH